MSAIIAELSGLQLPSIERQFIDSPLENATDVVSLDGTMYSAFTSHNREWVFHYDFLTYADYNLIRAIYDSQFTTYEYPELTIDFYEVDAVPVRVYINDKDIFDNCGDVVGVELRFRETRQMSYVTPDYILGDNGDMILLNGNDLLVQ